MRQGRCKYPVSIVVRADSKLRAAAGEALRREGTSVAAFVRDRLRSVVERNSVQSQAVS